VSHKGRKVVYSKKNRKVLTYMTESTLEFRTKSFKSRPYRRNCDQSVEIMVKFYVNISKILKPWQSHKKPKQTMEVTGNPRNKDHRRNQGQSVEIAVNL
jgi:hypothetical protein